ncbi:hypothetical protein Q4Q39_10120 [Flavivirga amylovorans]|uniref:Adhesin domain-containing protein n=1 Tax=Flavivirga amylovorans TaxID=870486 RepID=A0ABT8X1C2_9FLAO|nr:hypothetical protein [Flavivirga amylovorans]MDO5987754.1 hypothetical protein [Flavivirga amylovorans]
MMYILYKKIIPIVLLLLSFSMYSQEVLTKTIEEIYEMTNSGELHLENKYGNVTINGWEENDISIKIDVKVSNKKKDDAKILIDRIVANSKTVDDFVSIISEISDKNTSLFSRYFNKVNPFEFDKSNVEINMTIYLPMHAEIDITNKFGDVIIDNWTGRLKANIEHGDLWINEDIPNARITMKFGKLRSKSITYGTINLKNGDLDIASSDKLLLRTSGTKVEIDHVEDLEIISSKDEIIIQEVNKIQGELNFSNAQIEHVQEKITLNMKVAELRIAKINKPDAYVSINQESSDININITGLSFKFNATLEQGLLRLPKTFYNIENNMIDKSKRIREINAIYGKSASGIFSFNGKKGIIVLKE